MVHFKRYAENWFTIDPDMLVSLLDWYIERWTRHGKLLLWNTLGVDPEDSMLTMQLACTLVVMGRNTFIKGHPEWGYALSYVAGGWKNPTFTSLLGDQKLGAPTGPAVRTGYVYTREFEFARVMLDTEGACRIEWLHDDGTTRYLWEKKKQGSNITPDHVLLGADRFDGNTSGYVSRDIVDPINNNRRAWGEMNRATAKAADIVDTSLTQADGSAGDGADELGFLASTKTDGIFAMAIVDNAEATWTFNVTGYHDLSVSMDWVSKTKTLSTTQSEFCSKEH